MPRSPHPTVRDSAALADKAPTQPLMPGVVAQEELIPLADLVPDVGDFAMRVDLRADALADELQRDGQLNAIDVWSESGKAPYQILAGHRRRAAADQLGWQAIRGVVHRNLTREQAWRLAWKDNAERRSLSQHDRWWTVARLLSEGRNQTAVAALLGVDKSIVSRDAGWTRLPEAVRDQVGQDGFSHAHAIELIPHLDRLDREATAKVLAAYRKKPCDVRGFRALVARTLIDGRGRWPRALKVKGQRVIVDVTALHAAALAPGQVATALALLRQAVAKLEGAGSPDD